MPQLTRFLRGAWSVPPLILVLPSALWAQAAVDLMGVLEVGQPIEATLGGRVKFTVGISRCPSGKRWF